MRLYDWSEIDQIVFELKNHKVAVVETDTVIGLISLNANLIYTIKKRSQNKKIIRFITKISDVKGLSEAEQAIIKPYWPGGLTIIKHNISYRIPNHQKLLELISKVDFVYSSSANISGNNPILHTQDAINIFKKHNFDIVIVDGHQLGERPSTIIDLDRIKVLRIGTINPEPIIKQLKDIKSSSNI